MPVPLPIKARGVGRMMPYNSALDALVAYCQTTRPIRVRVEDGLDRITAAPVNAPAAIPSGPIALQDGWAVAAEETLGASPYAPAFASTPPRRVAYGDFLPDFADAVLPLPNVVADPNSFDILSPAAPGEGARARGGDLVEGEAIVAAGKKLKMLDIALLKLAGIENITVRIPHVRILSQCDPGSWLAAMAEREGAQCRVEHLPVPIVDNLAESLAEPDADFMIAIGFHSTRDSIVRAVELSGKMLFDSVAVRPGEAICCGIFNQKARSDSANSVNPAGCGIVSQTRRLPILFIPGRMECVLTAWLLLVRPCLQGLTGAAYCDVEERLPLTRKITSTPGLSELALVRRIMSSNNRTMFWEPLATGEITLSTIAHADAWLLVEAGCEGYAAGQIIGAKLL
jgi:molybdopterin molybdotransferase